MKTFEKVLLIIATPCAIFLIIINFIEPQKLSAGLGWLIASLYYIQQLGDYYFKDRSNNEKL